MKLKKFVVFVTLFGTMCRSEMSIKISEPDGFAELEEAVIQILTICYANQDKTVALIGEFPDNFVRRLSSLRSFSIVLIDSRRRVEQKINYWRDYYLQHDWNKRSVNTKHKVHFAVLMAPSYTRFAKLYWGKWGYENSPYSDRDASLLTIGWSPINKHAGCDGKSQTYHLLRNIVASSHLPAKLLCQDRKKGLLIYDANPFTNKAPEPWRSVNIGRKSQDHYFVRQYRKHEGICKNLYYDKTHDLGGVVIKTLEFCEQPPCRGKPGVTRNRLLRIEAKRRLSFIDNFFTYANATRVYKWITPVKGKAFGIDGHFLVAHAMHVDGMEGTFPYAYPYRQDCKYLISQFRGNKSQLKKIIDTIDSYSWISMGMVYVITWMYFKFFLRQPLLVGIMNLFRLTCNFGLTTNPENVSSRIYFGCLLFFVVTLQGIFVGNLASLLTHDIPVRQINTMKDLVDLGYTVYAIKQDHKYFTDPTFKDRLIDLPFYDDCIKYIKRDPSAACLTWNTVTRIKAINSSLHISSECFAKPYITIAIPLYWRIETAFDKYLKITLSADIMLDLDILVDEQRLFDFESMEVPEEPEIMTLSDLGFAFAILGIGVACSLITFIIEIMIHRFNRRVTRTPVIVL